MNRVSDYVELENVMLEKLEMKNIEKLKHYSCYTNDQGDLYHTFYRDNCYALSIADYCVINDFSVQYTNPHRLLRFGTVYTGITAQHPKNTEITSFSPTSFLVMEENLSTIQTWKKAQHFHGTVVTLYGDYFNQVVTSLTGQPFDFSVIEANRTYYYLSNELTKALQQMQALALEGKLNPIYLESRMLGFIGILVNELGSKNQSSIYHMEQPIQVTVGGRSLTLSRQDLDSISQAHDILTRQYVAPPTIEALSKLVLLNSQKLKAGFLKQYHMTMGQYITTLRMSDAAVSLCTTNDHIHDIGMAVGYSQPGNFIRMFKQYYGETPLEYRKKRSL